MQTTKTAGRTIPLATCAGRRTATSPRCCARSQRSGSTSSRSSRTASTSSARSTRTAADKAGTDRVASDLDDILAMPDIDAVVIATRHQAHAAQAARALDAGRDVFVEKPAAIDEEQLALLGEAVRRSHARLLVG